MSREFEIDPRDVDESLRLSELAPAPENFVAEDDYSPSSKEVGILNPTKLEMRQGYRLMQMHNRYDFRQVYGSLVVRDKRGLEGYRAITEDQFCELVYREDLAPETLPSDARSLYSKTRTLAKDFTSLEMIRLGNQVWDTTTATLHELDLSPDSQSPYAPRNVLWYSPYTPTQTNKEVEGYLLSLANNNKEVVEDIVSSIAVTFIAKKPRGVFWWIGKGRNGKSVLMDLMTDYVLPNQVSRVGMAQLESGRGVGDFNSSLMNISTEALGSSGLVDDATHYKNLGAHETFKVKQLWKDEYLTVRGGINCIYAVNVFPDFKEKNEAIISRTKIIEFANQFEEQTGFKDDTFTPEFVAAFIARVLTKAREIYEASGVLLFSEATKATMDTFSQESNPGLTFLAQAKFVGFARIEDVYNLYTDWHKNQGIVSNIMSMREFSGSVGGSNFKRRSLAFNRTIAPYFYPHITPDEIKVLMNKSATNVYYQDGHTAEEVPTQLDIVLREEKSDDEREW